MKKSRKYQKAFKSKNIYSTQNLNTSSHHKPVTRLKEDKIDWIDLLWDSFKKTYILLMKFKSCKTLGEAIEFKYYDERMYDIIEIFAWNFTQQSGISINLNQATLLVMNLFRIRCLLNRIKLNLKLIF
jgi:hypothetical protein